MVKSLKLAKKIKEKKVTRQSKTKIETKKKPLIKKEKKTISKKEPIKRVRGRKKKDTKNDI